MLIYVSAFVEEEDRRKERNVGNSKFYMNENKQKNFTLEDYFFDLECQMENNTVCRDLICTSGKHERGIFMEFKFLLKN